MKNPIRKVFILIIGVIIMLIVGGGKQSLSNTKRSKPITDKNIQPKKELTVAIAQISVKEDIQSNKEDIQSNIETISRAIDFAIAQKADILLTPEGSLSGYTSKFDRKAAEQGLKKIVKKASSANLALALGTCFVEPDDNLCYNQIRFYDGKGTFLGFHNKILRTGNFDEPPKGEINDFAARPLRTFNLYGITIGGLICNDMWANPTCSPADAQLSQQLSKMGAKIIFVAINGGRDGSEWSTEVNWPFHETNLRMRAQAGNLWMVTADSCFPTDIPCSAPSGVLRPDGSWAVKTPNQGEQMIAYTINLD